MGFLDKAKDLASKMSEKAGPLAEKAKPYADKAAPYTGKAATLAAKGVSEAASRVDKATKGKYHSHIETASGKLGDALNRHGNAQHHDEPGKPPKDEPGTSQS